jgi:hypothetical protein
MGLMNIQKEAVMAGLTTMVTPTNIYNAASKFTSSPATRTLSGSSPIRPPSRRLLPSLTLK